MSMLSKLKHKAHKTKTSVNHAVHHAKQQTAKHLHQAKKILKEVKQIGKSTAITFGKVVTAGSKAGLKASKLLGNSDTDSIFRTGVSAGRASKQLGRGHMSKFGKQVGRTSARSTVALANSLKYAALVA